MKHASNHTQQERIGKRLKQVRQYLLLTQQQVGEATAIPVITISKIEHDKSVNSDSFIQLLLFYSNYIVDPQKGDIAFFHIDLRDELVLKI